MKKKEIKKETKKNFINIKFILKILFSLVIGFLPSFLFITLIIQYGSPFLNYIKFLFNFKSSWIAWIASLIISSLVFFIIKIIKSKESIKKILKNKYLMITIIFSSLVILFLIFTQLYLFLNFTLRNDILVRLSADKDNIFFTDNPDEDITFKISVTMNPFCSAGCDYEFFDISNGKEIEKGFFNTASIVPKYKTYTLNNTNLVEGSQIINRFEVSCKSKKNLLCYTKEEESKRSVIITLNYDLTKEESELKENSKKAIISLSEILYSTNKNLEESVKNINSIGDSFFSDNFLEESKQKLISFTESNNSVNSLKEIWEIQDFPLIQNKIEETNINVQNLYTGVNELNLNVFSNISLYNNLTENLTSSRNMLEQISKLEISSSLCEELNVLIIEFNTLIKQFKEKSSIPDKESELIKSNFLRIGELYKKVKNIPVTTSCILKEPISQLFLTKIAVVILDKPIPSISLEEPVSTCCFLGECDKCCDDRCSKNNYPVIFLHGHSINKALPVDYSLDSFTYIKEKLTDEFYIDAGALILNPFIEQKGLWGKVNAPITVTASYFFDIHKTEGGETIVSSNLDNIDTYAVRLKGIVDLAKRRTNKEKVIIIAHSMGGVVTRRYIQIFGGKDVEKIILITVPNHGIDDKIRDYCALIGPEASCRDLDKDSILINKINNAPTDIVPTHNIIGIGCNMGTETGEGIVKNSSQYLDYATNYYIKGVCNELNFEFFHETILYPDRYPEVYNIISKIIKADRVIDNQNL